MKQPYKFKTEPENWTTNINDDGYIVDNEKPSGVEYNLVTNQSTDKYFLYDRIVTIHVPLHTHRDNITDSLHNRKVLVIAPAAWTNQGMQYLNPFNLNDEDYHQLLKASSQYWLDLAKDL